jgi:hypothetical protein
MGMPVDMDGDQMSPTKNLKLFQPFASNITEDLSKGGVKNRMSGDKSDAQSNRAAIQEEVEDEEDYELMLRDVQRTVDKQQTMREFINRKRSKTSDTDYLEDSIPTNPTQMSELDSIWNKDQAS